MNYYPLLFNNDGTLLNFAGIVFAINSIFPTSRSGHQVRNNFCLWELIKDDAKEYRDRNGHDQSWDSPDEAPEHQHNKHCDNIYREGASH